MKKITTADFRDYRRDRFIDAPNHPRRPPCSHLYDHQRNGR